MQEYNVKQILVIRRGLKIRRGKEGAQLSHASGAWYANKIRNAFIPEQSKFTIELTPPQIAWCLKQFTKIICQVPDETSLLELYQKAKEAGLETHLITDAGKTEFNGVPTHTAVGIGPDFADRINPITSHLALY